MLLCPGYGDSKGIVSKVEAAAVNGRPRQHDEFAVKAGFLANFVKYTKWPKRTFGSETEPIVVLLIGTERRLETVQKLLSGKKFGKRKLRVLRTTKLPKKIEAHVVMASELSDKDRSILIAKLRKQPVLLLGDSLAYAKEGATMNFYLQRGSVRFAANLDALREARLTLSAQVLKLAKIVSTEK